MIRQAESFLPLSQATYYILLALRQCRHGYAIMQDVEKISRGSVALDPGTLYGALSKLQKQDVIKQVEISASDRRKYYVLTNLGEKVVKQEYERLLSLVVNTQELIEEGDEMNGSEKIRFFLASNVEKEEKWLNEMSERGLHFQKYRFGVYYFHQNLDEQYIYQIDFHEAEDEYFSFYSEMGWKHIDSSIGRFHYFRKGADQPGVNKIYTDLESMKESVRRMVQFYMMMFLLLICSQTGLIFKWRGIRQK